MTSIIYARLKSLQIRDAYVFHCYTVMYEYEYEYDDQIVCAEVEKSLFEKKIEKKEGKAYNKQGASKRPNVEV